MEIKEPTYFSACCGASFIAGDICGKCREHTGVMTQCSNCDERGLVEAIAPPESGKDTELIECPTCQGWGMVAYEGDAYL